MQFLLFAFILLSDALPFRIEDRAGSFIARTPGYDASISGQGVIINGIRMQFEGGSLSTAVPAEEMKERTYDYSGEHGRFHTGIRNYKQLTYSDVYPDIDVVFRGAGRTLEFDFLVAAGADPSKIGVRFSGHQTLTIDSVGAVVLKTASGELRLKAPQIFQEDEGRKIRVDGRFVQDGDRIRFHLHSYDRSRPLVIDPQITFATYVGVSNYEETPDDIEVDSSGNVYTEFELFPAGGGMGGIQRWIRKIDRLGGGYFIRIPAQGFRSVTTPARLAVDAGGSLYVAYSTIVESFVTTPGVVQSRPAGAKDVYLMKFNSAGEMQFATYLGGTGEDHVYGIALGDTGTLYITGYTTSSDFPLRNPFQSAKSAASDSFITTVNDTGTTILYSTYFGGAGEDHARAIHLGEAGHMYLTGTTTSPDFPTQDTLKSFASPSDIFALKLNPAGNALVYSTLLGSDSDERWLDSDLDGSDDLYLLGITLERLGTAGWPGDRYFLQKLNPSGSSLFARKLTQFSGVDSSIAVDDAGSIYLAGTGSAMVNSIQSSESGGALITIMKLDTDARRVIYSTRVGGETKESLFAGILNSARVITADNEGNAYVAGITGTSDFPVSDGTTIRPSDPDNSWDAFVLVLAENSTDTAIRTTVLEEDYAQLHYSGTWTVDASDVHHIRAAVKSNQAGAKLSLNLTGPTELFWQGCVDPSAGFANVYVDNVLKKTDDWYSATRECKHGLHSVSIGSGSHTVTFEVSNERNPASQGNWIWFDRVFFQTQGDVVFGDPTDGGGGDAGGGPGDLRRFEQNATEVQYSGDWNPHSNQSHSAGSAALAYDNAAVVFNFRGSAVRWIGLKDPWSGIAAVYIDGALKTEVDTYSHETVFQAVLYSAEGLDDTSHTLRIEATGRRNPAAEAPWIWVDAFEGGSADAGGDDDDGDDDDGDPGDETVRVEEGDSGVKFSGSWYSHASSAHSDGTSALAIDAGAAVSYGFSGTSIRWIGVKDEWSGIADVYIDNVHKATVDTYAFGYTPQAVLFAAGDLPAGNHVIQIVVRSEGNPSAAGSWIWVDAFETAGSDDDEPAPPQPPSGEFTRAEQTAGAIRQDGFWNTHNHAMHSGGSAALAIDAGAAITFSFTGVAVRWIGFKDPWAGIAEIYVDDVLKATVDTFTAGQTAQAVLYSIDGLASGAHTLRIVVTGTRNPLAEASWIWVDALEYR